MVDDPQRTAERGLSTRSRLHSSTPPQPTSSALATRKSHRLAFPLSLVNAALSPIRRVLYPLDPDKMMRAAQRGTKLKDFGDDNGFEERFRETVASVNRIDWNLVGRAGLRVNLMWSLGNRLRITELLKQHPKVRHVELDPPIVILGLFRTGSTFLHHVLAADDQMRAGWMWEFGYPAGRPNDPLGDVPWRRKTCKNILKLVDIMVPDQGEVHAVTAEQREEDFFLLENDFSSMKYIVGFGDWQLGWDLLEKNLEESYLYHRLQLQLLSANHPQRPWVLKCPWHMWNLETFMKVYPDARLVQTHREIAKAIGSQCSLSARISCRMKTAPDLHEVGRFWTDYIEAGLERGLAVRDQLPNSQVFDIRLKDLRRDPRGTLKQMYEHFDIERDDARLDLLEVTAGSKPTQQHGVHDYSIEEFGLDPEQVRERFAAYRARFGV